MQTAGQVDVVARSQLIDEATGQLNERCNPVPDRGDALVREEDAGDHLEQGALAAAVAPYKSDGLTPVDLEGNVAQCPERLSGGPAATMEDQLPEGQLAASGSIELDADVVHRDD